MGVLNVMEPARVRTVGEPAIILRSLETLSRGEGARYEWEKLIADLVKVDFPGARNPEAVGGDQGIDVVEGKLSGGDITIWQAKYYTRIGDSQRREIRKSFETAWRKSDERGNRLIKWVLCIPINLDVPTTAWWDRWCEQQRRDTGIHLDLWDETEVVRRLRRPAAADVRRYYFGAPPATPKPAAQLSVELPIPAPAPPEQPWRGGDERSFGGRRYMLYGEPVERHSLDHTLVWREAVAGRIDGPERVFVRQAYAHRARAGEPERARAGLRDQARLLDAIGGRAGLPRLVDMIEDESATTILSTLPVGPTWQEAYPSGKGVLDPIRTRVALGALRSLCRSLDELHRHGASHRTLHPACVILADRARRALPRDVGLAGMPPVAGEGHAGYRAPEQEVLSGASGIPGPRTDVYQVAALVYQILTGNLPARPLVPVRAGRREVPKSVDNLLGRCLDVDPGQRPASLDSVVRAIDEARKGLSGGYAE